MTKTTLTTTLPLAVVVAMAAVPGRARAAALDIVPAATRAEYAARAGAGNERPPHRQTRMQARPGAQVADPAVSPKARRARRQKRPEAEEGRGQGKAIRRPPREKVKNRGRTEQTGPGRAPRRRSHPPPLPALVFALALLLLLLHQQEPQRTERPPTASRLAPAKAAAQAAGC